MRGSEPRRESGEAKTMHIARRFTTAGSDPYEAVPFRSATSEIRNPDGSVVFAAEGIEVPAEWSQVACDILAQKYLRKAGVPARLATARTAISMARRMPAPSTTS